MKTQAAKLFEGLCDNVDGAVTLTSYFCIQALNMTLSKESGKPALKIKDFAANIEKAHEDLILNCAFVKHSKPDQIVESSIMVLSILSYVYSKPAYTSIFNCIEQVFSVFINDILQSDSKLIKVRYSLFLGYVIDVLYKKNSDAFKNTITFLYSSVDLTGEDKAIALQSIDTLNCVTCDKDLVPRIIQLNLLPELVGMITNSI